MFKKLTCWIIFIYGLFLAVMGSIGYYNSGSKPSLIMGVGFGAAMILSSRLLFLKNIWGVYTSILATLLLTITFAMRFHASGKLIPGLLCLASGALLVFISTQLGQKKKF